MALDPHHRIAKPQRWLLPVTIAAIIAAVGLSVGLGMIRRDPGFAIVLATIEDCRRAFDDASCKTIVARAQAIYSTTAPIFVRRDLCEFAYGAKSCTELRQAATQLNLFAPTMTAIALTRDQDTILPLYTAPPAAPDPDARQPGRPVFFHGKLVGRLQQPAIGGATLPLLNDPSGDPLSEDEVRKLGSG
jgi:hypothetical protein